MEININCRLAAALAGRMREAREDLTRRWLERIVARVAIDPNRVFPTDELLNHVPLLMDRIADYMEDPADEISADAPVTAKAIELGELRYSQGFDAHQILKEYEILGGVLFAFLVRTVDDIDEECTRSELLACAHRLFRAVTIIQQVTTTHYLRLGAERVNEREERLRGFNRMVSHELKNRIGAVLGAGQLLADPDISADPARRERFARIVVENAHAMQGALENLIELSRMDPGMRRQRNVVLPSVVAEVARQLREMAQSAGVEVRIDAEMPQVEVNAAALELALTNYLSNAIKYSDPAADPRWVRIGGHLAPGGELVVEVEDNGLGVPPEKRADLFTRFFRAHGETVTGIEGTGLGLSIVRETVEALGGRAWAEFDRPAGSRFLLSLPSRRAEDRHAALPQADGDG
ncbi:MAG TPA: sensor histidine kinase [Longimicrobium sp.]|jgi:signal transduction histidine kinase